MSALESGRLLFKHPCEPGALGGIGLPRPPVDYQSGRFHDGVCQVPGKEGLSTDAGRSVLPARGHYWVIPTECTVAGRSFGAWRAGAKVAPGHFLSLVG